MLCVSNLTSPWDRPLLAIKLPPTETLPSFCLASISTVIGKANTGVVYVFGSSEGDEELLVAEPGHGRGFLGEFGGDEEGVVSAFVEGDHHLVFVDANGG